jgi:hypothetical protein
MSWHLQPPPINEGEDEFALKMQYAEIVARDPSQRQLAGYAIFPGAENYGRAMQASAWFYDPVVQAEIARLAGNGEAAALLPDEDAFAKKVLDRAEQSLEDKDAFAGFRLYAELKGFVKKGPAVVNDNRTINVLRVPTRDVTPEDDEDFERRFEAQQIELVANVRSSAQAA